MSLILEALKKSEQQRRLGEAPTLGSPVQSPRRRRSWLPLFGALIAVALGAGWWFTRTPGARAPDGTVAQIGSASSAVPAQPMPAGPQAAAVAPAADMGRSTADRGHAGTAPRKGMPDRPGSVVPLPPAPPAVAGPKLRQASGPTATPTARKPPAAPATAVPSPQTAVATTMAAPRAAAPALPLVWELPYATRKDLPDLSLTMHVYAADPHQRFVVIKGERHAEGADLGNGVTLREIRPDGVVLEFKGQRFVYPRDGR